MSKGLDRAVTSNGPNLAIEIASLRQQLEEAQNSYVEKCNVLAGFVKQLLESKKRIVKLEAENQKIGKALIRFRERCDTCFAKGGQG